MQQSSKFTKTQPFTIVYNAPPLIFSNLNIKTLSDLKHAIPKQGERKIVQVDEPKDEKKKEKPQESENNNQVQQTTQPAQEDEEKMDEEERQKERERREKEKQKELRGIPQIVRTIGQPIVLSANASMPTVDEKKDTKKNYEIQLVQNSLILSYNKLTSIVNFYNVVDSIMHDCAKLQWIDLSHNCLESLDYNFSDFRNLKTLYLHANKLKDIGEFQKLKGLSELRSLTVHGNPLDSIPNFRLYLIGILPDVRKLDSVLISKKELDNALVWKNTF